MKAGQMQVTNAGQSNYCRLAQNLLFPYLQEEYMLTGIMTLAICSLLASINESNPQDYVYAAMFMISTTCFLKIQWLVGTSFMMLPLAVTHFWHKNANVLPTDAMVHLIVSWAVGGFMAYLSDTYRR